MDEETLQDEGPIFNFPVARHSNKSRTFLASESRPTSAPSVGQYSKRDLPFANTATLALVSKTKKVNARASSHDFVDNINGSGEMNAILSDIKTAISNSTNMAATCIGSKAIAPVTGNFPNEASNYVGTHNCTVALKVQQVQNKYRPKTASSAARFQPLQRTTTREERHQSNGSDTHSQENQKLNLVGSTGHLSSAPSALGSSSRRDSPYSCQYDRDGANEHISKTEEPLHVTDKAAILKVANGRSNQVRYLVKTRKSNIKDSICDRRAVVCHFPDSLTYNGVAIGATEIHLDETSTPLSVLDGFFRNTSRNIALKATDVSGSTDDEGCHFSNKITLDAPPIQNSKYKLALCLRTRCAGTPIWLCESENLKKTVEEWSAVSDPGWPRLFVLT